MTDLFEREHAIEPLDGDKGRSERGAYFTPDGLALAICGTLQRVIGHQIYEVLEPGCGGGAFLRAARAAWPSANLNGIDLEPACDGPGFVRKADLFAYGCKHDLVLGNPDYAIAERAVRHCLSLIEKGGHLAFLLRAAFLGSEGRIALYEEFPLRFFQPIGQRPSFTANGKTDPMEYGLFVWRAGFKGQGTILQPLRWR